MIVNLVTAEIYREVLLMGDLEKNIWLIIWNNLKGLFAIFIKGTPWRLIVWDNKPVLAGQAGVLTRHSKLQDHLSKKITLS